MGVTRLLLVWPYAPWPPVTGTSRRLARVTEEVAARLETAVVVADTVHGDPPPPGVDVRAGVRRDRSRPRAAARALAVLGRGDPVFTAFYRQPRARRAIASVVADWQPDVVWTHGIAGEAMVRGLVPDDRVVLDLSDAEHLRFARMATAVGGARGRLWAIDARRVRGWAARRLPRMRAVTVVSEDDRDAYAALAPAARFVTLPNGVDPAAHLRPDPANRTVVFLGDLGYPPNAAGLHWLVHDVLPLATTVDQVLVAGRGTAPEHPRLQQLGFVPDLDELWRRCAAMVVPIHDGGGTRLKVLDAFGAGVPVVSTSFGVSGLGAVPGEHYLLGDTAAEFARTLTQALDDPRLRNGVAERAWRLVGDRFTWSGCVESALAELGLQP